jgi:hypothetical protein
MSEIASQNIHQHLIETLDNSQARYRIVDMKHPVNVKP